MSNTPLPERIITMYVEGERGTYPIYKDGYTADQMHAHAAAVSADLQARLLKMSDTMKGMDAHEAGLAEAQAYLMAENARLREAIQHYEDALHDAFPNGARGDAFTYWNAARKITKGASHE